MSAFSFHPTVLAQHLAILGRTGSGKSYTAKGAVESLLADKRRVCILDPTGIWYGLRSSADGKSAGFPVVVFGGQHADVAINQHSGPALAKILAAQNLPAIVDLSEMLIGQRHRFVTDFAEALYRENRTPLHLVIDEADEFCPQNPLPETKRMLHHIDRIVRRGRVRGFRVMLITQRPAVLNKNVLTQANALIAMRLTGPQDRLAMKAWIDGQGDPVAGKEVLDSLAQLKVGEGWVWAPEVSMLERVRFPRITTFDSGRTPGDDEKIAAPTKLAAVDISGITASFEAIEKDVETVAELKVEVKRLREQLAKVTSTVHPQGVSEAEVKRRVDQAIKVATDRISGTLSPSALKAVAAAITALQAVELAAGGVALASPTVPEAAGGEASLNALSDVEMKAIFDKPRKGSQREMHRQLVDDILARSTKPEALASQPALASIGLAGAMPGTSGFTVAVFRSDEVPVGTELYLASQPARERRCAKCC